MLEVHGLRESWLSFTRPARQAEDCEMLSTWTFGEGGQQTTSGHREFTYGQATPACYPQSGKLTF